MIELSGEGLSEGEIRLRSWMKWGNENIREERIFLLKEYWLQRPWKLMNKPGVGGNSIASYDNLGKKQLSLNYGDICEDGKILSFSKCFELIPRVDSITFRFCLGIKENNQRWF